MNPSRPYQAVPPVLPLPRAGALSGRRPLPRHRGRVALVVLAASAGVAQSLHAQDAPVPAAQTQPSTIDPLDITGRDFAGVRLGLPVAVGPLAFSARSALVWNEPPAGPSALANAPHTRRIYLSGDVTARLADNVFSAARAAVFLLPLREPDPDAGAFQVFIYFDRVGTSVGVPGLSLAADRLPVQGVVRPESGVKIKADSHRDGPPDDPFVLEAERALASALRELVGGPPLPPQPATAPLTPTGRIRPGEERPYAPVMDMGDRETIAELARTLPSDTTAGPIFTPEGVISISPNDVTIIGGEQEDTLLATGGVIIEYWDRREDAMLHLSAERAAVFLDPGLVSGLAGGRSSFDASKVRGVYLEGAVLAQGQTKGNTYTIRSPRVYYDVRRNRAVLLDAVFSTFDQTRNIPLYVRAKTIRQESADQFSAKSAVFTNSPFFKPHLSLGTSRVTINRKTLPSGENRTIVDAHDITLRAGDVPFFWWPRFYGDPTLIPIRDLRVGATSGKGTTIETAWDALSLLGIDAPDGVSADLLLDFYFKAGPGVGADVNWDNPGAQGNIFAYSVPDDQGTDVLASGARRGHEDEFRGVITGEHRQGLGDNWELLLEGAYISDENFIDSYFSDWARSRREFANSAAAVRNEANTLTTLTGKGALNDFTPNEYLLQSRGYVVERLPEASYIRLADDVFSESAPGLLTWSSEYRVGYLRQSFTEPTADELGYESRRDALETLGVEPDESIADRLRADGYTEEGVARADTRQEVSAQLAAGPVNITPFAVGRATVWDDNFDNLSPQEQDYARFWGSVGTRLATTILRIDNSVRSRVFDLHRIRHIVEPSVTVVAAGSTVDREDLPVYDDDVEGIAQGTTARFALDQTWQTQRGGPGRWRSVDVFKLNFEYAASSNEGDPESPIGRFIDYRPELSNLGEFMTVSGAWQATEAVAVAGATVYDIDLSQPAKTSIGILVQHSPEFSTFGEMRYVNAEDSVYYTIGAAVEPTKKYRLAAIATFDSNEAELRSAGLDVKRRIPSLILGFDVRYNHTRDETSLGFSLQPSGLDKGARLRGLGSSRGTEGSGIGG